MPSLRARRSGWTALVELYPSSLTAVTSSGAQVTTTINNLDNAASRGSRTMSFLSRELRNIGTAILIWQGFRFVTDNIRETIEAQYEYSLSTAQFALVTQQSVDSAISDYNRLRDVTSRAGIMPSEAGAGIIGVARFTKAPEEQEALAEAASQLTKILGIDFDRAVRTVGGAVRQMNLDFSQSSQVVNLLAGAFITSGGDIEDFVSAMAEVPTVMDVLNVTFEQALGIITGTAAVADVSANSVASAMTRMGQALQGLEGDKLFEVSQQFKKFNIDIINHATGGIRPVIDILHDAQREFQTIGDQGRKQDLLELLFGGQTLRPQYRQVLVALLSDIGGGLLDGASIIEVNAQEAADVIDKSLGQIAKRIDARIEEMRQNGENIRAGLLGFQRDIEVLFGGEAGARHIEELATFQAGVQGEQGAAQ